MTKFLVRPGLFALTLSALACAAPTGAAAASPSAPAAAGKAVEKKEVEDFFVSISRESGKSTRLAIRYDYDASTFSTLEENGVKGMKEATRSAEYVLRTIANHDETSRKLVDAKVKKVVVLGGRNEPSATGKEEWSKAEEAERGAKRKLAPNDPNFEASVRAAKYGHFLTVSLEKDTLVLQCQLKNCVYANQGTFGMRDDVNRLLK